MDILEHLTKEHRDVEGLLDRLESSEPGAERDRLIAEPVDSLGVHMDVEEQFLYPIVAEELGSEESEEATNEHQLARDGLEQLQRLSDEGGFAAAVEMVKAGISHHVDDEEKEMFPELREKAAERIEALDPEELEQQVRSGSGSSTSVDDLTRDELYERAKEADISGRSDMTKEQLADALGIS